MIVHLPQGRTGRVLDAVRRDWPIWLVSTVTLISGLLGMLLVLLSRFTEQPRLFNYLLPVELYEVSRTASLALGFVLVYLSFNLLARKKAAWWLTILVCALHVLAHLGHGHAPLEAIAPAVAIGLLVAWRKRFTVKSEASSQKAGIAFMTLSIIAALAWGTAGFWLLDRKDFGIDFGLLDSFVRTLREFALIGSPDLIARTHHARWFLASLRLLGLVSGSFALFSLFRPVAYRLHTLPQERVLVQGILARFGSQPLDYYKLLPDKSYFFSERRTSCIAYKTALNIAISLGDATGPPEELSKITLDFLSFCTDNGWRAAFLQVLPDHIAMYRQLGLSVLKIGEEAVIDLEHFVSHTLVNSKELQRKSRRLEKAGLTTERYEPPHVVMFLNELKEVSDEWLSLPGRRERGFSLGRFDKDYIAQTPVFIVRVPDGKILAFVNEVPAYRAGEASIDLMRHRVEIPNGAMDFLFYKFLLDLMGRGYSSFNLGLAALSGVGGKPGASLEEEALHLIYEHLNRFFSYKGLRKYKAKFEPRWENRYLVYRFGPPGLVKTALAIIQAGEEG